LSSVWIQTSDPYLEQRFSDIGFPRLNLVLARDEFGVYANPEEPVVGNVVSELTCADVSVQVVSYD
jgi:hypothetical protein